LGEDKVFYASKIQTMQFYFHYEIPRLKGLAERLMDKTVLTIFDDKQEVLI
jgi:Acetyl-CoA dehydrogenase C-terminal like